MRKLLWHLDNAMAMLVCDAFEWMQYRKKARHAKTPSVDELRAKAAALACYASPWQG